MYETKIKTKRTASGTKKGEISGAQGKGLLCILERFLGRKYNSIKEFSDREEWFAFIEELINAMFPDKEIETAGGMSSCCFYFGIFICPVSLLCWPSYCLNE